MPHRGEILEAIVRKKHNNLSELGRQMKLDRGTLYRHFGDADLDDGTILQYAKALKYDFSKEFPDLLSYTSMLQEPLEEYRPITVSEALQEVDYWRKKYIELLEAHTALLREMIPAK